MLILNELVTSLPIPPYTPEDAEGMADQVYNYVWQRCASGHPLEEVKAA